MAIKPVLVYKNADSTADLNSRAARILDRGIYDGGHLSPSAISLTMDIAPFIAVGWDGMVAISDDTETLTVPGPAAAGPNRISYVILHLEYRSLTTSIANLTVVPETTYLTSISKEFFVTFIRVEVPFGATSLQDPGVIVDYSAGDWAEKAGKSGWRSPVANFASLPAPVVGGPSLGNRDGDVRLALDTMTPYAWDAGPETWSPVGAALNLLEATALSHEHDNMVLRAFNGSGIISSTNNDFSLFPTLGGRRHRGTLGGGLNDSSLPFLGAPTSANRIDLAPLHALLNGHFVKTPYTQINLSAPAAGRYDMVFLEVWREVLPGAVASETYPNDPTSGGTSTFAQLRDQLEQLLEQALTPNIGFGKIEAFDSSTFVANRWRIAVQDGVPPSSLGNPIQAAVVSTNIDGNAFSTAANQNDQRLWSAASVTSVDGISWAIPLMLIRRTLSEVGPASYVLELRPDDNNDRYIFDLAPRAELGAGMTELSAVSMASSDPDLSFKKSASGFTRGMSQPILPTGGGIVIPSSVIHVRGAELSTDFGVTVPLPAAPAAGSRRDLVVIEVEVTSYPHGQIEWEGDTQLKRYNRQGLKQAKWIGRSRVFDVGSDLDTPAAMVTAGYATISGDPGLWERTPLPHEDNGGLNGVGSVYAIPVALVHRRNTAPFSIVANQNGTSGRPDGITSSSNPAAKEILDLRHRVLESEAEVAEIMKSSLDKLYRGELRTRMRLAPGSADVAGIQTLQVDQISAALSIGTHNIQSSPNGSTTVWGDSDEAVLLTAVFPTWNSGVTVTDGSSSLTFRWTGTPTDGVLLISAPSGYVLNVDEPGSIVGPSGVRIGTATVGLGLSSDVFREASFTISSTAVDGEGNTTSVISAAIPLPAGSDNTGQVYVQVWARRPARGRATAYSNNFGMREVADRIHRIEYFNGTTTVEADTAPIVTQITATPVADVITITQADLFAALGGVGNKYATNASDIRMYAVLDTLIQGATVVDGSGLPKIRYIDLRDAATTAPGFENIRIEFRPGSVTVPVTFTIAFDGNLINRWAVITPLNRGVRGLYSWSTTQVITGGLAASSARDVRPTRGASALPSRSFMVPMKDSGYSGSFLGVTSADTNKEALGYGVNTSVVYARNTTALTPQWQAWTDPVDRGANNIGGANTFNVDSIEDPSQVYRSSGYSAFVSVGYGGFIHDIDFLVVSPCRVPLELTERLTLFYDITPYQGLADAYPLQDKTTGRVLEVGEVDVHTMGTNMPWLSPRVLRTPTSGVLITGLDYGSQSSRGQALDRLQNIHLNSNPSSSSATLDRPESNKPIGALTRRLPFVASNDSVPSDSETLLENTTIGNRPFTESLVIHPEEANGDGYGAFTGMTYNAGNWEGTSLDRLVYPLPIPDGAEIRSIVIRVGVMGGPSASTLVGILDVSSPTPATLFSDVITATSTNEQRLYGNIENNIEFPALVANSSRSFALILQSNTVAVKHYYYTVTVYYQPSGLSTSADRMVRREYSGGSSYMPPIHKGALLENPWNPADFAALESVYLADGESTYGSVPRGKSSQWTIDSGSGPLTLSSYGPLFYYVPLSDLDGSQVNVSFDTLSSFTNWPLSTSLRALDLPRSFAGSKASVFSARSPDSASSLRGSSFAGAVLPYMVRNNNGLVSMVVSHSSAFNIAGAGSEINSLVGHGAIDAFYPAGRPIYIKED